MLFLLFQLGPDHYALDATQVVEVLPMLVQWTEIDALLTPALRQGS